VVRVLWWICDAAALFGGRARADTVPSNCYDALRDRGVSFRRLRRRGIAKAVRVTGPISGVSYRSYTHRPLILDCSLVYSLAAAGPLFRKEGIHTVFYSSAYDRRNIRGTNRPSSHSFGLAIDMHSWVRGKRSFSVRDDYEQGLGDNADCAGRSLTAFGRILRTINCDLSQSGLFRVVLTPDFDADHYNHFHVEARPWRDR